MLRSDVDIRMLGGFELRDQRGRMLALSVRKAEALLALLSLEPGRALTRSKLCGMLWPNVSESQARHSLRQTLVAIRKLLPHAIDGTPHALSLCAERVRVDVADVARCLSSGTREDLDRVASVYRGDLLDGIVVGEEPFEQWLTLERERIRAAVAHGLCKLIDLHEAAGGLNEALQVSKQVLQLNPLHERTLRTSMRLLAQMGRRAEAVAHYHGYARMLQQSFDAQPEAETRQLSAELAAQPQRARGRDQLRQTSLRSDAAMRPASKPRSTQLSVSATPADELSVGLRSAELALLERAWGPAGSVNVCLVEGEAGVGKSHLCGQLAQRLAESGCRVLRGRCFESEQVLPFSCWSDLLLQAGLVDDADLLAQLSPELRCELARILPELSDRPPLQAADDSSAVFHALASVIAAWSQAGPICLVLDDLHWADDMSLRFLCYATRRPLLNRCLIVATARQAESAAHAYLPRALAELSREQKLSRVTLAPFSHAQTCALAEHWGSEQSLRLRGTAWLERIWQLSEGNALVILECVRALARPEAASELSLLSVPERIRALIRHRIAALSDDARELATLAAVYGRELQPRLFAACMDERALSAALQELAEAQLLHTENERVSFAHDRVRETLYEELLPAARQLLHGRIAAALTASTAYPTGAALGQAGYHHAKAGNAEAAIALLVKFSEHAVRSHALNEALVALDEAISQAQSLPLQRRADLLVELVVRQAFCLAFLNRLQDIAQRFERWADVLPFVSMPRLAAAWHYWHGFSLMFLGRNALAREHAEHALRLASEGDGEQHVVAHNLISHQCLLTARFAQGEEHAERALELSRDSELSETRMFAYLNVCLHRVVQGRADSALAGATQAEREAERSGSGRSVAMAAVTAGLVHAYMQRWDLALAASHRALAASQTPFTLGPACALLALVQFMNGEAVQAAAMLGSIREQLNSPQPLTHEVVFMLLHAEALLRSGAPERAKPVAEQAVAASRELDHIGLGLALRALSLAELRLGETAAARTHVEAALAYYETLKIPLGIALVLVALAELERAHADRGATRAKAVLTRAHAVYVALDHAACADQVLKRMQELDLA